MDDPSSLAAAAAAIVDPETAFLASTQQTGNEWELYKENVRPLKRGRNVKLLNQALRSQSDNALKKSLISTRRRYIESIEAYSGEDPIQPWLECIKWVQESFPAGGDHSGLVVIYEQCARKFWHDRRYKNDLRYLKVWLEYASNCADAEVIYSFLEANQIGLEHSVYYSSYASHLEAKNKMSKADEIFNLGIARRAIPLNKLEDAYKSFLVRSTKKKKKKKATEVDSVDSQLPVRSFGSVLTTTTLGRQSSENSVLVGKRVKLQKIDTNVPLSIYKDPNPREVNQPEKLKSKESSWNALGTRSERNKENTAVPAKWASFKVPQKQGATAKPTTPIEVFVDEECAEFPSVEVSKSPKPSVLRLRKANSQNLKTETELLKVNPLRNFHLGNLR